MSNDAPKIQSLTSKEVNKKAREAVKGLGKIAGWSITGLSGGLVSLVVHYWPTSEAGKTAGKEVGTTGKREIQVKM